MILFEVRKCAVLFNVAVIPVGWRKLEGPEDIISLIKFFIKVDAVD